MRVIDFLSSNKNRTLTRVTINRVIKSAILSKTTLRRKDKVANQRRRIIIMTKVARIKTMICLDNLRCIHKGMWSRSYHHLNTLPNTKDGRIIHCLLSKIKQK